MTQPRRPALLNKLAWQLCLAIAILGIIFMIAMAVIMGGPLPGLVFGIGLLVVVAVVLVLAHFRMTQSFRDKTG
jgi:uncharacterized membrane protein